MKFLFSLIVFVTAITNAHALESSKATKQINRAYKVTKNVNLEISNKYGQVIINTWKKDSVLIKIDVTGFGKDRDASKKLLERAEFEFSQIGDYVIAETILDRSQGFIKDLWNSIGDYSKSLLGKNKLSIDYEIYMPTSGSINIIQKFGDLYIDDLHGKVTINLSNGNLKMDNLTGTLKLDLEFGRANINHMKSGIINLRSAEFEVDQSNNIELTSSSSTTVFKTLSNLKIDSRNDRIRIDSLETLHGDGSFSNIFIKHISRTILADMNYGELWVSKVGRNFKDLQLKGKSTDFDLMFAKNCKIDVSIVGREDEMTLSYGNYEKTVNEDDDKLIEVKGTLGIGDVKGGNVDIYANDGRVKVQYETQ